MPTIKIIQRLRKNLLNWYREEKRDLPWRNAGGAYPIWVSEIMLQQTQVKTVIPYYRRWLKSFPTVERLADAAEDRVLKHWQGLGYYTRARNLRRAAKIIVRDHGGNLPDTLPGLLQLPGIGRYTAGAILSIAFGKKVPVLDGNVKRVISRWFCLKENGGTAASEKKLWQMAQRILPAQNAGDFNQALMELGATLCLPKSPLCLSCPVNNACEAGLQNRQHQYPPPKKPSPARKIEVAAAVILKKGKTYIQQRLRNGLMGGLWEFPGGKLESGETLEQCLLREIREEMGVDVVVGRKLMTIKHSYTRFRVTLHVYQCRLPRGRIRATECEQWKWVRPDELPEYPFPAANVKIVDHLMNGHARGRKPGA